MNAAPVALDPYAVPEPIDRSEPAVVEVELTAREVVAELANGQRTWVWSFNGSVPGPLIRAREGDTVSLRLHNALGNREPHSIDLHAVTGPGGGHAVTEVAPGQTKELRFRALHQGMYFYHCAAEGMAWEHVAHGMYGAILIEPPTGLAVVDREIYLAQSEWYLAAEAQTESEDEEEGDAASGGPGATGAPLGAATLDEDAARRQQPVFYTFNGHRTALTASRLFGDRIHLKVGERLRIFFANAGPNLVSSFHVVGGIFDRVVSGHFDDVSHDEETIAVAPGSAAVFELTFPVAGTYSMLDHALSHAQRGAVGLVHVDGDAAQSGELYSPEPHVTGKH